MATRERMVEKRRAQLIETACQCILEKGYQSFTLQDVTGRLGLSKGSLYHHFQTKEELLLAVLDHLIGGWDRVIEGKLEGVEGAEEKLSALLEASFEIGRDGVSYQILVDFWGEMDHNPAFREANAAFYARYRRQIAQIIEEVGAEVAVGSYLLGPFTLAGQVMELNDLLKLSFKQPAAVDAILERLSELIIALAGIYRAAGADYLTVREMGACADVLNPRVFKSLIQPHLTRILGAIPGPRVLHICGSTNAIVPAMAECGADALSVDQKNDLAQTRRELGPNALIFGNFDPYKILAQGTPRQAEEAAQACITNGASAVWPGCDIWPTAPAENVRALVEATGRWWAFEQIAVHTPPETSGG